MIFKFLLLFFCLNISFESKQLQTDMLEGLYQIREDD